MTNDFDLARYLYEHTNEEDIPNLDKEYGDAWFDQLDYCESPIEKILYVFLMLDKVEDCGVYMQQEFNTAGGVRRVDFLIGLLDPFRPMFIIEADGELHNEKEAIQDDKRRDRTLLREFGLPTVRYTGQEIMSNPEIVRREIHSLFERGKQG